MSSTARASVVVCGATGRMGRTVTRLALADERLTLLGGVDRDGAAVAPEGLPELVSLGSAGALLRSADVIVDFSAPAFLQELLSGHADDLASKALVVGTTGLSSEQEALLDAVAERTAVLTAANFSVGVNLLIALVERAAASLGAEFDIEIVEAHHRRKEDAPSGTALALGQAAAAGRGVSLDQVRKDGRSGRPGARPSGEIGFHSLRGGDIIGDHQVHFISDLERIEIAHRASDRSLFAAGALEAAKWLSGRPAGRYTMRDVLDL